MGYAACACDQFANWLNGRLVRFCSAKIWNNLSHVQGLPDLELKIKPPSEVQ